MKYLSLFLLSLCFAAHSHAQDKSIVESLNSKVPGEGRVTIHQDPRIGALLGRPNGLKTSEDGTIRMAGFRVQVFSGGNTRDAKKEAEAIAARVRYGFPELRVYTTFNPPRWVCRVGDFASIEEADAMMRRLRRDGGFREATIVKEQVYITL